MFPIPRVTNLQVKPGNLPFYNWFPDYWNQFPWRKWVVWRVECMTLFPAEVPHFPKLYLPQAPLWISLGISPINVGTPTNFKPQAKAMESALSSCTSLKLWKQGAIQKQFKGETPTTTNNIKPRMRVDFYLWRESTLSWSFVGARLPEKHLMGTAFYHTDSTETPHENKLRCLSISKPPLNFAPLTHTHTPRSSPS